MAETLRKLPLQPEDAAVAELALKLAETIDEAAELAEAAGRIDYDPDTAAQVARLKAKVEARTVAAEVGPKLLATLTALGATPAARSAAGRKGPAGKRSALAALREAGAS